MDRSAHDCEMPNETCNTHVKPRVHQQQKIGVKRESRWKGEREEEKENYSGEIFAMPEEKQFV